jgi:hypothetical protein
LLPCEEGLRHRSGRPIEPEAVFGQIKANKHYKRFRHFGKTLITMDFAIFAIAFNTGKMWNQRQKKKETGEKLTNHQIFYTVFALSAKSVLLTLKQSYHYYSIRPALLKLKERGCSFFEQPHCFFVVLLPMTLCNASV